MARITVEDCIDKIPSRFELVLIASQRARKLHTGDQPTVKKENDKNSVIALREIETESISLDNLKENLIKEYQTVSINENEDEDKKDIINTNELNKSLADEVEEEIKSLESAEDDKLKEQYEIQDSNQTNTENIASDSYEDQDKISNT